VPATPRECSRDPDRDEGRWPRSEPRIHNSPTRAPAESSFEGAVVRPPRPRRRSGPGPCAPVRRPHAAGSDSAAACCAPQAGSALLQRLDELGERSGRARRAVRASALSRRRARRAALLRPPPDWRPPRVVARRPPAIATGLPSNSFGGGAAVEGSGELHLASAATPGSPRRRCRSRLAARPGGSPRSAGSPGCKVQLIRMVLGAPSWSFQARRSRRKGRLKSVRRVVDARVVVDSRRERRGRRRVCHLRANDGAKRWRRPGRARHPAIARAPTHPC